MSLLDYLISGDVYWDIDQLGDMKLSLEKKLEEVRGLRDEFVNQKNLLSSVWQGSAGELELYRLEQSGCKFETLICRMETELAVLDKAIKEYSECEKSVLAKVRNGAAYSPQMSFSGGGEGSFSGGGEGSFGGGGGGSR